MNKDKPFKYHVFFCSNVRDNGEKCCGQFCSDEMRDYAKKQCKNLNLNEVRINKAGCLGRCELGPIMVVYPQNVWYTFLDKQDIDEIIENHLSKNEVVERLIID